MISVELLCTIGKILSMAHSLLEPPSSADPRISVLITAFLLAYKQLPIHSVIYKLYWSYSPYLFLLLVSLNSSHSFVEIYLLYSPLWTIYGSTAPLLLSCVTMSYVLLKRNLATYYHFRFEIFFSMELSLFSPTRAYFSLYL